MRKLKLFVLVCLNILAFAVGAEEYEVAKDSSNLMLVVRTSFGVNKADSKLSATGPQIVEIKKDENVSFDLAHYEYLGDAHIRFVFDSEKTMANLSADDFKKLKLSPEQAVELAIKNIHRDYGKPEVYKSNLGVYKVQGKSKDLNSSYFLDANLWQKLSESLKDKLIVALPSRGVLLFAPSSDKKAVKLMSEGIQEWFVESGKLGVSSALFSYENGQWSVYQAPKTSL